MLKPILLFCAFTWLVACQQVGPSFVVNAPLHPPVIEDGTRLTQLQALPLVGSAQYTGRIGVGFQQAETLNDLRLVGDLDVTVDFLRDRVDGSAHGFQDRLTGERLSGAVEVISDFDRNIDLDRFYGLTGRALGTLKDSNDQTIGVDLDLNGDFYGSSGSRISGDVTGEVSGLPLTPDDRVTGSFDANR